MGVHLLHRQVGDDGGGQGDDAAAAPGGGAIGMVERREKDQAWRASGGRQMHQLDVIAHSMGWYTLIAGASDMIWGDLLAEPPLRWVTRGTLGVLAVAFGLTAPLLLESTGEKLGKTSTGERVWLGAGLHPAA